MISFKLFFKPLQWVNFENSVSPASLQAENEKDKSQTQPNNQNKKPKQQPNQPQQAPANTLATRTQQALDKKKRLAGKGTLAPVGTFGTV